MRDLRLLSYRGPIGGGGGGSLYGPNLLPPSPVWAMAGTVKFVDNHDGTLSANGVSNAATAGINLTLEDNTTYLVTYTLTGTSACGIKTQTYGATTAHLGTSTVRTADGTYSEEITTNGAGSLANQFRFQSTANSTPGTTCVISNISLQKKLGSLAFGFPQTGDLVADGDGALILDGDGAQMLF